MRSSFCNAHAGNDMEHHGRESREQKEEERDHELELARRYEGDLSGLALPAFAGFVDIWQPPWFDGMLEIYDLDIGGPRAFFT